MKSTCFVYAPDGRIWKSDNVPEGKENEFCFRLLNMNIRSDCEFIQVPWYPDISVRMRDLDLNAVAQDITTVSFRQEGTYRNGKTDLPGKGPFHNIGSKTMEDLRQSILNTIVDWEEEEPEAPEGINDYDCTIR